MQYKPPSLKKKSSTGQTPSKPPAQANPPGYHLIPRNTNFRGTYTLDDENSPEKQSYQSPYRTGGTTGSRRGPIVKASVPKSLSHGRVPSHTSATQARELPGSREPGMIEHGSLPGESSFGSSEEKSLTRKRSQLKTPQSVVAGYNSHHTSNNGFEGRRGGGGRDGRVGLVRQIRGAVEDDGISSSSSLGGEGEAPRLAPVKPKGKSRR